VTQESQLEQLTGMWSFQTTKRDSDTAGKAQQTYDFPRLCLQRQER